MSNLEHDHEEHPEWGLWWPVSDTDCVRQCLATVSCQATQESEYSRCRGCDVTIIELKTNFARGHTHWVPYGDIDNYGPCSDEDGMVVPHTPKLRSV